MRDETGVGSPQAQIRRRNLAAPTAVLSGMEPFIGTEAVASGSVTPHALKTRYRAVFRNVYVPRGVELTAEQTAVAAWLWSGRRATVAGLSAAALHGSRWIDPRLPAELNQASQHRTTGIVLHNQLLCPDELMTIRNIAVTTPARTAFDLGRRGDRLQAVIRVDALMRATGVSVADVQTLVERHRGARGVVQLRRALDVVDGRSESPQETRVRLVLIEAGLPRPTTQFEVWDGRYFIARLDMAWPHCKVGVEYDGVQHWTDARQRTRDIDRSAELEALGWRIVRVSADMLRYRPRTIVDRVRAALDADTRRI